MANTGKIALVDLDGTLLLVDRQIELASKEVLGKSLTSEELSSLPVRKKHPVYTLAQSKYAYAATANAVMKRRLAGMEGTRIVILTARHADVLKYTLESLRKEGVKYDKLICRGGKARLLEDEEWKLRVARRFAKRFGRVCLYDDKPDNLAYIRKRLAASNVSLFKVSKGSVVNFGNARRQAVKRNATGRLHAKRR